MAPFALLVLCESYEQPCVHHRAGSVLKGAFFFRFGQPDKDEMTILAPLYQCCVIRQRTLKTLLDFHLADDASRRLSRVLKRSISFDPVSPVLTEAHLRAIDRRLDRILDVVQTCMVHKKADGSYTRVIVKD